MSYNESYYRERLSPLLNSCIQEMRRFDCESEPTNEYGYSLNLPVSINSASFRQLNELISDMVFDNDVIAVPDANIAANVFTLMACLSDNGIIENVAETSEDEYDENGIQYAKKEKVCYPLLALLFANKCDFFMLGSRIIPRILIGGEQELKSCFEKWRKKFKLSYPDNVDVDKFFDTLFIAYVPSPDSMEGLTKVFFRKQADLYNKKLAALGSDYQTLVEKGRGAYLKWILNMSGIEFDIEIDRSSGW